MFSDFTEPDVVCYKEQQGRVDAEVMCELGEEPGSPKRKRTTQAEGLLWPEYEEMGLEQRREHAELGRPQHLLGYPHSHRYPLKGFKH